MEDSLCARNASISDTSGQFLLLVDDFGIRNAFFNTIEGGSASELDWQVPAGNYLILPIPGNPEQYAVFINELPPSRRAGMVLVDLAANAGAGAMEGETTWYMDHTTAKITATTDSTETGYWIVQHQDDNDAFLAFHLTSSGLQPTPVTSHIGSAYLPDTGPVDNMDRRGQMNFNFQGDMLGAIKLSTSSPDTCKVELFTFDRSSGTLAFWAEILARDFTGGLTLPGTPSILQGLDFDSTGQYLFVGVALDLPTSPPQVYVVQFDLAATSPDSLWNQEASWNGFGVYEPGDYDSRYGNAFTIDPYGYLLAHPWYPPFPATQYQTIYREFPPVVGSSTSVSWQGKIMGGLPAPCKRYDTLDPQTIGFAGSSKQQLLGIHPNPFTDKAVLVYRSSTVPESVVWRDALGREARIDEVKKQGKACILERGDLRGGSYFVEVRGKQGPIGVVKVVCE